jgi:hypothetical protein
MSDIEVIHLDVGNRVICDDCDVEYSDAPDVGGLLFQSKAICPACAPKWEASAKRYGEEQYIRARCPEGKSFAAWVREDLRAPRPSANTLGEALRAAKPADYDAASSVGNYLAQRDAGELEDDDEEELECFVCGDPVLESGTTCPSCTFDREEDDNA